MDFLDPKLHRRHTIILYIGYIFVALAILIGTLILMNIAYGFGLGKNGKVVQNGFLYLSSSPAGAQIRLNGTLNGSQTNTRLSLNEGSYHVQLERPGYRVWQRDIALEGGSVVRYDYPLLIAKTLTTTSLKKYSVAPSLATQSPDRRWLIVQHGDDAATFDLYDLKSTKQIVTSFSIPPSLITAGDNSSWQLAEWSTDNQHVLLQHNYDGKSEFIMVNRADPPSSVNLNQTLGVNPSKISLRNKKYDQYYLYEASTQQLTTADLGNTTPVAFLDKVLAYQSYGSDVMLYATTNGGVDGKVAITLLQGGKKYVLRQVAPGTTYLVNLTKYSGDWYVALGASSEGKVYVYKDPLSQLQADSKFLTPTYILKTANPTYLAFSNSAQYIMDENGTQFSVYDIEYQKGYTYDSATPLDAPQAHATWMDGNRLTYVSGGKVVEFDYDHINKQTLVPAQASTLPFFDPAYKVVDVLTVDADGKTTVSSTPLRTPADQ